MRRLVFILPPILVVIIGAVAAVQFRRLGPSGPVRIGAAESVYADIASQIAGPAARVEGLAKPTGGRVGSDSRAGQPLAILLRNGGGYDDWAKQIVQRQGGGPKVLTAMDYIPPGASRNPYVWYNLAATRRLAAALAKAIVNRDPNGSALVKVNLRKFMTSLNRLNGKIAEIRKYYRESTVILADPLYENMMEPLGFRIEDQAYLQNLQRFGMPIGDDERKLREAVAERKASILLYNSDRMTPFARQLLALAKQKDVPAVGIRETKPSALNYQTWMLRQLDAVHGALNEAAP